jgi:hypothetical protein
MVNFHIWSERFRCSSLQKFISLIIQDFAVGNFIISASYRIMCHSFNLMILLRSNVLLELFISKVLVEFFRKPYCIFSESSLKCTYGKTLISTSSLSSAPYEPPLTTSRSRSQFILLTYCSFSEHIIAFSLNSCHEII